MLVACVSFERCVVYLGWLGVVLITFFFSRAEVFGDGGTCEGV